MTRREQFILLAALAVVAAGGFAVKFKGSASLSEHGSSVHGTAKVANSTLRRGLAYANSGLTAANASSRYGAWSAPRWSIMSAGGDTLRPNHPLFRRPGYIGQNRHKVMSEGWGGWYYNPPSEDYF